MGKKRHSTGHVSKGERRSSMKTGSAHVHPADKMIRKLDALAKGKNVKITMENPNKEETNRQFITHKIRGKDYQKFMTNPEKGMVNPLMAMGRS